MTDQEKEDYIQKLFKEALIFYEKEEYVLVLDCIEKVLKIDPDNAKAYFLKGSALYEFKDSEKSIEAYDKAIRLFKEDNDRARAYFNKGGTLIDIKEYKEVIEAYEKAIELYKNDNDKAVAYFNKGNALYELKEYQKAIAAYDKAIELYKEKNDKAKAYFNKGIIFFLEQKTEDAIKEFNKSIKLNSKQKNANQLIAYSYLQLKDCQKAGEFFAKEGTEVIEVISLLEEEDEKANADAIVCDLLKNQPNNYFWKVLDRTNICRTTDIPCENHKENCEKCKIEKKCGVYRQIYVKSLQIIASLQVNDSIEEKVAHYTTKDSARLLLLGKDGKKASDEDRKPSLLRLTSTAKANDPKEGQTLFDYLFDNTYQATESEYRAFISCFTFNQQSLNQFRLYGKEKGREASGISIVIKNSYFSKKIDITQNMKTILPYKDDDSIIPSKEKNERRPLFRCIYLDPETDAVISLGHKELYAYIREEMEKNKRKKVYRLKNRHTTYLDSINTKLNEVSTLLQDLKDLIIDNKEIIKRETVSELLLMLSHLVKHVAFKEEQECRILEIASLTDGDEDVKVESEIDNNCYRMFIDYLPMTDSVDRLYMGNQFEDFALFKDIIKQKYKGKVSCYLSTHPFAIT